MRREDVAQRKDRALPLKACDLVESGEPPLRVDAAEPVMVPVWFVDQGGEVGEVPRRGRLDRLRDGACQPGPPVHVHPQNGLQASAHQPVHELVG